MKTQSTKRALLLSVLSMPICCAMLVGSTFAWFTDTASTAVSMIQSGTLDIDIVDEAGASLARKALKWNAADKRETILWEPGATYTLPPFKLVNNGSLALKYQLVISGIDGDAKLLEAIDFTMTVGNSDPVALAGFTGVLLPKGAESDVPTEVVGETALITITGHMKEEAGNDYQGLSLDGIGITVVATQYTFETDSDDDQYDANALFPTTANDFVAGLDDPDVSDVLVGEDVDMGKLPDQHGNSTISVTTDKVIDFGGNTITRPDDGSGNGLEFGSDAKAVTATVKNANFSTEDNQLVEIYRGSNVTFENTSFKGLDGDGMIGINLKAGGNTTTVVFKNCTFNTAAVEIAGRDGKAPIDIKFINCTFTTEAVKQLNGKTYSTSNCVSSNNNLTGAVSFEGCTFNWTGSDTWGTTMFANNYWYDDVKYNFKDCTITATGARTSFFNRTNPVTLENTTFTKDGQPVTIK